MTSLNSVDADAIADSLRRLGAARVRVTHDGDIDFAIGRLNAFAYSLEPARYRISFVLAPDPPSEEALRWVTDHDRVSFGAVRLVEGDGTSDLLFTVDVQHGITNVERVIDTAIDLLADWSRDDPFDITATLADAGVVRPPLGAGATTGVRAYGPWWWATRLIDPNRTLKRPRFDAAPV